jgi:hypothetical protein
MAPGSMADNDPASGADEAASVASKAVSAPDRGSYAAPENRDSWNTFLSRYV